MPNRERLNNLSDADYALEMQMFSNCTVKQYVDYEGWLKSENEEYPIIGKDAVFHDTNEDVECKLVERINKTQALYVRLVVDVPGLHCFKTITVPAELVDVGSY